MSSTCHFCGGEIIFRYVGRVLTPVHLSGSCSGTERSSSFSPGTDSLERSSSATFGEDFCRPTSCPICKAKVFFIRHNDGSVWVDELGWPWPKHGCFDDNKSAGVPFFEGPDGEPASELLLGLVEWGELVTSNTTDLLIRRYEEQPNWRFGSTSKRLVTVRGDHVVLVGRLVGFSRRQPILVSNVRGHSFVSILKTVEL